MSALLTRPRLARLAGFASTQVAVQALGFVSGIVLVRHLAPADYGVYTLAVALVGVANVVTELGLAVGVLAIGGRTAGAGPVGLGALVADAQRLHAALAAGGFVLVLPAFALLLRHQHAAWPEVAALVVLGAATAWLNVRSAIVLSVARLQGALAAQQRVDLALNALRLAALMLAAALWLDAVLASVVNLGASAGASLAWRRWLRTRGIAVPRARGAYRAELRRAVWRQAPNSLWYVVNGQVAVWLVGLLGTAERVADVGALGRLGAAFAVVAAVMGAMIQPYFARTHRAAELEAGFAALNAFFAATTLVLAGAARLLPGPILWVLGPHYAGLGAELAWMVLATALSAWAAALYTIGCGRGWVLPSGLGIVAGLVALAAGARWLDLATVAGTFQLNTLTAGVAVLVNFGFVARCLLRHRQGRAPSFGEAST